MNLGLEVFWVAPRSPCQVAWARRVLDLGAERTDPDLLVRGWLQAPPPGVPRVDLSRCLVHSTSWRYAPPATLLVTYLVYGEAIAFEPAPTGYLRVLPRQRLPRGTRTRPRPGVVTQRAVLRHGLRHLAFLLRERGAPPGDWLSADSRALFMAIEPAVAGGFDPVESGPMAGAGLTRCGPQACPPRVGGRGEPPRPRER